MDINFQNNLWRTFAVTGDPLAYLEYTRIRNDDVSKGRTNENRKTARIGS